MRGTGRPLPDGPAEPPPACLWSSGRPPLHAPCVFPRSPFLPGTGRVCLMEVPGHRPGRPHTEKGLHTGRPSQSRVRLSKCPATCARLPAGPGVLANSVHSGAGGAPMHTTKLHGRAPPGVPHLSDPAVQPAGGPPAPSPRADGPPLRVSGHPLNDSIHLQTPRHHALALTWAPSKPKSDASPSPPLGPPSDSPQSSVRAS